MNLVFVLFLTAGIIFNPVKYTEKSKNEMVASWYECCKITANGEKFNPNGLTAAHKSLPFGTKLKIRYKGKTIVVRINDRGPYIPGRQLDLSRGAARKLGCKGVCRIEVERIS
jgi:rare lipoprotein A